jgi:hypothetical protein
MTQINTDGAERPNGLAAVDLLAGNVVVRGFGFPSASRVGFPTKDVRFKKCDKQNRILNRRPRRKRREQMNGRNFLQKATKLTKKLRIPIDSDKSRVPINSIGTSPTQQARNFGQSECLVRPQRTELKSNASHEDTKTRRGRTEDRGPASAKSRLRRGKRGLKTHDGGQRSEDRGQKTNCREKAQEIQKGNEVNEATAKSTDDDAANHGWVKDRMAWERLI